MRCFWGKKKLILNFIKNYLKLLFLIINMNGKIWTSVDPIHKKVDVYPGWVTNKIEEKFRNYQNSSNEHIQIPLGSKFFNATINFKNGNYYQTTPSINSGSRGGGGKPPGYRRILPIEVTDGCFTVYAKQVSGEWRICEHASDSHHTFNETLNNVNDLLASDGNIQQYFPDIQPWCSEDILPESDNNKNVSVWMWCRGVPERQGNIFKLSDSWWVPYFCEDNKKIDEAFNAGNSSVKITLFDNTERIIEFQPGFSCYAKQTKYHLNARLSNPTVAVRMVKKVTITVALLKQKLENLKTITFDPSIITTLVDTNDIPHEFYCSISQDVMTDPVKTVDNHTYDRTSIERWFQHRLTSPLTGLTLASNLLVPNDTLREQIHEFARVKIQQSQQNNSSLQSVNNSNEDSGDQND